MADAVGLAASIAQIVSTGVQASVYLYNFAETVSSAGKALKEISSDISLTTSVLQQLKTVLESEKDHETASKEAFSAAEALIQECSNTFEAIVTLIKKQFPDLGPRHRTRSKLNLLKWPIIQPKIETMRSNLEKHKTKLILMTQVLTLAKMAVSQQRDIEGQIEKERQKLEALVIVSHRTKIESKNRVNTYGLTEVFNPTVPPSIDIVFVHSIFGHPKDTWTCEETDVFWPAELLPPILEDDGTRVLTYGYEATADSFTDGEQRHKVHEIAGSLGRDLASNRQALAHSSRSPNALVPNIKSISLSTYGVVFLATPHNILASHMNLLCDTAIHKEKDIISQAIEQLKAKHTALHLLNQDFLDIAHEYRHHCFQEMLEPKVFCSAPYIAVLYGKSSIDGLQILDNFSARLSMLHSEATCIYLDHYRISKFGSRFSHGFDLVCAVIQDFVNRAPGFVSSRWKDEETKTRLRNNIPVSTKLLTSSKAYVQQAYSSYGEQSSYPVAYHYQTPNCEVVPAYNVPAPNPAPVPAYSVPAPNPGQGTRNDNRPLEQASLLPKYPGHNQSQIHPQQTPASMKTEQTSNYHTSGADLGQTDVSNLTDDQIRQMDNLNFPAGILPMDGAFSAMPKHVKTWSELKSWLAQNQVILPSGTLKKFQGLQDLHFQDLVGQQWQFNKQWSPVEPNASCIPTANSMHSLSYPTTQEIQDNGARSPDHVKWLTDDQLQAETQQMQPDMPEIPYGRPESHLQQQAQFNPEQSLNRYHLDTVQMIDDCFMLDNEDNDEDGECELMLDNEDDYFDDEQCELSPGTFDDSALEPSYRDNRIMSGYSEVPPPRLPSPVSELQTLDPTEEERLKAKEEVLNLLRQWTTSDTSAFA